MQFCGYILVQTILINSLLLFAQSTRYIIATSHPISTIAQVYSDKLLSGKMLVDVFLSFVFYSRWKDEVPLQLSMLWLYWERSRSTTHCQHRIHRRRISAVVKQKSITNNSLISKLLNSSPFNSQKLYSYNAVPTIHAPAARPYKGRWKNLKFTFACSAQCAYA